MTLSERSAYLKGLMEGLKLDTDQGEGKMIAAIVEMLGEVSSAVSDIEENALAVSDELDEIEEDLDALDDAVFSEDDEEDDDEDYEDDDEDLYEVKCPSCGEVITVDEATIDAGSTTCPKCGETLEFEGDDTDEDAEDNEDGGSF